MIFILTLLLAAALNSNSLALPRQDYFWGQFHQVESHKMSPRNCSLDADSLHSYDQISLHLEYRVESGYSPMVGIAYLTVVGRESISQIPFNAEGITISAVNLQDFAVPFTHQNDTCYVHHPLNAGDTLTFWFVVSIPNVEDFQQVGFHAEDNRVHTFSEPYGARRWYPCWDQPYDKFSETTIALNMPESWIFASNGNLIETSFPSAGRKRQVYHNSSPISSYLVNIAAGIYANFTQSVNNVNYNFFAYAEHENMARYDWERIPQMVELFNSRFGQYSFSSYGMVEAGIQWGWGAMEHQTMTTLGWHLTDSTRFWEGIYAHELAHQWFGDALSPVDFRNMWLNEGFATYGTILWYEHTGTEQLVRENLASTSVYYFEEDRIARYAVYDPPSQYLFGAAIYFKGMWVLHMLREQIMGDSLFFVGLNNYVNTHRFGNVDTEDFINSMSESYGQDLHWFFNQWIYQAGHPVLDIVVDVGDASVFVSVVQQQQNAPIFKFPLNIDIQTINGLETDTLWFDQVNQTRSIIPQSLALSANLSAYQPLLYEGTGAGIPSESDLLPESIRLGSAYPNPFNSNQTIPFELEKNAHIRLSIFDITGRFVALLADGDYTAGHHKAGFSPSPHLSSGIYLIKLESGHLEKFSKAVYLK